MSVQALAPRLQELLLNVSIQEQIACLEELSALDERIRSIDEMLSQDRGALAQKRDELARLQQQIEEQDQKVEEVSKNRLELVAEVRRVAVQVDKSREKLSRARNEREVNAATRELEELRRIQKEHEEDVGKLQLLETQALTTKGEAEEALRELTDQINASEGDVTRNIEQSQAERAALAEQRKGIVVKLPRQILSRYDLIRKRRGVAVASTGDGTCRACHMAAPPQLFQKILRSESLEQCPHCQRILYYKAEESTPES